LLHLLLEVLLLLQLLHSGLQQHGSANILDASQLHDCPIKEAKIDLRLLLNACILDNKVPPATYGLELSGRLWPHLCQPHLALRKA